MIHSILCVNFVKETKCSSDFFLKNKMTHNHIYWQYFKLGDLAYRDKVRLFEDNPAEISELIFEDRIEIEIDYLFCLFEIGRYERYVSKVDNLIELVIMENIYVFRGVDIYEELLFRKAACYFQLKQYEKSNDILKQLINLNKTNPYYIGLYTISKRKIHNDIFVTIKAIVIVCFMVVLSITFARIILEPFLQYYFAPFILLRTILILCAVSLLVGMEAFFQYKIYKETGMFTYQILNNIFRV